MAKASTPLIGEFFVSVDEQWRVVLPKELSKDFCSGNQVSAILAKERRGLLSLWHPEVLAKLFDPLIEKVWDMVHAPIPPTQLAEIQNFARLCSARRWTTTVERSGRLTIHSDLRDFAGLKPKQGCVVVGCGFCIELWQPELWSEYVDREIGWFSHLFERLLDTATNT